MNNTWIKKLMRQEIVNSLNCHFYQRPMNAACHVTASDSSEEEHQHGGVHSSDSKRGNEYCR